MTDKAMRFGVCCAIVLGLATGCDDSDGGNQQAGGTDAGLTGLDVSPGAPDTRPAADSPMAPAVDASDAALPVDQLPAGFDSPVIPGIDGPAAGLDVPLGGPDTALAIDAPGLPQPLDGGLACGNVGEVCLSAADCCGLACVGGFCAASACLSDDAPCTTDGECCSTVCGPGGTCGSLNPTCKTAGNTCTDHGECCNGFCNDQHQCASPGEVSYCAQVGDICRADVECCMGVCNIAAGALAGTCALITTTASCKVDGSRCEGCGDCCSHFCGPYGPGGPKICQPASGCHVQGDLCHQDSDCCGGDLVSGLPGAGLIKCEPDPVYGSRIGTCGGPRASNCPDPKEYETCNSACNPQGNVCHYKTTLVCAGDLTNVRNNCCGCVSGKDCCIPDATGIPRCNALDACVPTGGVCSNSSDCCDQMPCLPDPVTGQLRCGAACVPTGGICTTNADCCTGLLCHVTPGSLAGVCTIPTSPPTSLDGGVPPADAEAPPDTAPPLTCALFGQACSVDLPCCVGAECVNTKFEVCLPQDTDCVCYTPE
jgi:hypothetical protein